VREFFEVERNGAKAAVSVAAVATTSTHMGTNKEVSIIFNT
jgi:hypothetical protein